MLLQQKSSSCPESMGIFTEMEMAGVKPGCLWVAWVSESISCRLCVTEGTLVAEEWGTGKRIDGGGGGWVRVAGGRCGCERWGTGTSEGAWLALHSEPRWSIVETSLPSFSFSRCVSLISLPPLHPLAPSRHRICANLPPPKLSVALVPSSHLRSEYLFLCYSVLFHAPFSLAFCCLCFSLTQMLIMMVAVFT